MISIKAKTYLILLTFAENYVTLLKDETNCKIHNVP